MPHDVQKFLEDIAYAYMGGIRDPRAFAKWAALKATWLLDVHVITGID